MDALICRDFVMVDVVFTDLVSKYGSFFQQSRFELNRKLEEVNAHLEEQVRRFCSFCKEIFISVRVCSIPLGLLWFRFVIAPESLRYCQPIRCKASTNHEFVARVFPRFSRF